MMKGGAFFILPFLLCFLSSCDAQIKEYGVRVIEEYPHDDSAYTQGLFFHEGQLYESTGQYGQSSLRKVCLQDGSVLEKQDISRKYFAEGSVILDGSLFVLTWQEHVIFKYDPEGFKYIGSYSFPHEGWGLTTDGKSLIASDGTNRLYFISPEMKLTRTLRVTMDGMPLRFLNELEWVDGKIWANVYMTDFIVIIDPSTGKVEGRIDCTGLLPDALRDENTDVLNGIARDDTDGRIFLTGKNWSRMYRIELVRKRK